MSPPLSEEERQEILNSPPKGTWALTLMVATGMVLAWIFLYFGVFLVRGSVQ